MPFAILISALLELVRVLLALPLWCAVLQIASAAFAARQIDYVIPPAVGVRNPVHHVAAVGDQRVIVAFEARNADRGMYREITTGTGEPLTVRIPMSMHSSWVIEHASDALFATATAWWYATQDEQEGAPAVTFVQSDGSRKTYLKPPELTTDVYAQSRSWPMALVAGEKPRVLLFDYGPEQTMALDIDATGTKREWRLPPEVSKHAGNAIAEPLPDGRIALLDSHNGISMYLLGDDGRFDSIPLRNIQIDAFDGAIDTAGRILVATSRKDTGTIEAALIDPAHAGQPEWRPLPNAHVLGSHLRIVTTPHGFAATWINDTLGRHTIEAAGLGRNGQWGPVVDLGPEYSRGEPLLEVEARNDELLFWWDDDAHLIERRLPASLTAYAAMTALTCADPKKTEDPLGDDGLTRLLRYLRGLGALQ
ncbi:MAG TPA: hypothetical protein VGJ81_23180 [Thermoanaerobaculia bacterium]|jgi:hypothetical protein